MGSEPDWQGFEGPVDLVAAAMQAIYMDARVLVRVPNWLPPETEGGPARVPPPIVWDKAGTRAMFAVHTRKDNLIPCPAGLIEADPARVGWLVGA